MAYAIQIQEEADIREIENEVDDQQDVGDVPINPKKSKVPPKKKRKKWSKCRKEETPLPCPVCGAQFDYKCYLDIHMRKHMAKHQYPCKECGEIFPLKVYLYEHFRVHDVRPFKCELCGTGFTAKSSLQLHMVVHSGVKRFKCDQCGEKFVRKILLQKHQLYHTGEKPFHCQQCDKRFLTKQSLYQHIRSHTKDRPFKCGQCDFSFGRRESLQKHARLHTGEKPYNCEECQTKFARKQTLQQHLYTHNTVMPYKCLECDAQFQRKFGLRKHMARNHNRRGRPVSEELKATYSTFPPTPNVSGSYSCQECKRSFISKETFQQHNLGKCTFCYTSFGNVDSLHKHPCPNEDVRANDGASPIVSVNVEPQSEEPQAYVTQGENDDEQHICLQVGEDIYWLAVPKGVNPDSVHIITVKEEPTEENVV